MARQKGPVFGVDFLQPNALTEGELAKIRTEYHIPDSVMMRILGPLESLNDPKGQVVFFTDVFKHEHWLSLKHSVQKNPSSDRLRTQAIQSELLDHIPWYHSGVWNSRGRTAEQ